jgi:hypothetical protein
MPNHSRLSPKQIQYGFDYFHADEPRPREIVEVSQYAGQREIVVNCTQLGDSFTPSYDTPKKRKSVLADWCDFLANHPDALTSLSFGTKTPQELFTAACHQRRLKYLFVKWGVYPDISAVAKLRSLEYLHIGSGASVRDLSPVAELKNLVALSLENFQKISNYACLAELRDLESLAIEGDGLSPHYIHIDSIGFLRKMVQLRFLRMHAFRLGHKDFSPILGLHNLEHLSIRPSRELNAIYDQVRALPKLNYGLVVTKPELYRK